MLGVIGGSISTRRAMRLGASQAALLGAFVAASGALVVPAFADEPVVLGPLKVEDESDKNAQKHDTGLSVLPSTIQDTPQAITVVTGEQMKEQAVSSLEGALRNVPGITIAIGEGGTLAGDQLKIRGFDAKDDVYLDGLRDFGAYVRDSFNYEEVQVLKGPSGALFGRGTTGGAVNIISKRPSLEDAMAFDVYAGNGEYYRGLADVNYVLDDTIALRVSGMVAHTGVVDRDVVKSDRWGIAPSISLGLGTGTEFTLSWLHQQDNRIPDYGLVIAQPDIADPLARPASEYGVPRNTFTGYSTDRDNATVDMVTARLLYNATDWLTVTNDSRAGFYSRYFQYTTVDRCDFSAATDFCSNVLFGPAPLTALAGIGGSGPYDQYAWGLQNITTARADFETGGLKNQLIAGIDLSYQKNDKLFFAYRLPPVASGIYTLGSGTQSRSNIGIRLFNPDHTPPAGYTAFLPTLATIAGSSALPTTVLSSLGDAKDYGFFLTDRLWFNDEWSLIGSLRYDRYLAHYESTTVALLTTTLDLKNDLLSPRASLVFEPSDDQTYYISYGKSETPQGTSIVGAATAITLALANLDPEKSDTFEIGAKIGLFDGALGLTGSLFQVHKSNALQTDLNGDVTAQSGERDRVNGFELSATGQIDDDWTLTAAYTYLNSKITYDLVCPIGAICPPTVLIPNTLTIGQPVIFVPRNAASLWTTYDLHDVVKGLSLGGGVTYQDPMNVRYSRVAGPISTTQVVRTGQIPHALSVDAYAAYEIDRIRLALNVQNITDALYYTQAFGNRGTPAPGRTFLFSVSWAQ